jgi:hypothetical protein
MGEKSKSIEKNLKCIKCKKPTNWQVFAPQPVPIAIGIEPGTYFFFLEKMGVHQKHHTICNGSCIKCKKPTNWQVFAPQPVPIAIGIEPETYFFFLEKMGVTSKTHTI